MSNNFQKQKKKKKDYTPPNPDELRTPPHNDEAERSLLGAIFLDNRVVDEVSAQVQPEDLYRESHRHIYRAMMVLHGRGDAIDVITLADHLNAEGLLDAVGGPNFLARLSSEVPSAANVSYYATIVARKASLRNFISTAHGLIDECYSDVADFESFMDNAESKLFAITLYATGRDIAAVLWVAGTYVAMGSISTTTWTVIGQQLRRLLNRPTRLRIFNWAMAALLVASLIPVIWT